MKRYVIAFAFISGMVSIIAAVLVLIGSRGNWVLIGAGIGTLLQAVFMIGLGAFLCENDSRMQAAENKIKAVEEWVNKNTTVLNNALKNLKEQNKAFAEEIEELKKQSPQNTEA